MKYLIEEAQQLDETVVMDIGNMQEQIGKIHSNLAMYVNTHAQRDIISARKKLGEAFLDLNNAVDVLRGDLEA